MFPDVELQSKVAEFKKTPTFVHVSDHLSLTLSSTRQTINLLQKYDFATQALFSAFHDRDTIGLVNLGFQMCLPQVYYLDRLRCFFFVCGFFLKHQHYNMNALEKWWNILMKKKQNKRGPIELIANDAI